MLLRQDRDTHLRAWASTAPKETAGGLTVKQEIKAIGDAMTPGYEDFLAQYGGFAAAGRRLAELQRLPEARVTEGVSIDGYSTFRATRFAGPENGFDGTAEGS